MPMWDDLAARNIAIKRRSVGAESIPCPKCGPTRKKKSAKCLYVRVEVDEIRYHCFNCEFKGRIVDGPERERPAVGVRKTHKPYDIGAAKRRVRYDGYRRD